MDTTERPEAVEKLSDQNQIVKNSQKLIEDKPCRAIILTEMGSVFQKFDGLLEISFKWWSVEPTIGFRIYYASAPQVSIPHI